MATGAEPAAKPPGALADKRDIGTPVASRCFTRPAPSQTTFFRSLASADPIHLRPGCATLLPGRG